jgi:6-pyruvoyl-tetrahydropterin synthase
VVEVVELSTLTKVVEEVLHLSDHTYHVKVDLEQTNTSNMQVVQVVQDLDLDHTCILMVVVVMVMITQQVLVEVVLLTSVVQELLDTTGNNLIEDTKIDVLGVVVDRLVEIMTREMMEDRVFV